MIYLKVRICHFINFLKKTKLQRCRAGHYSLKFGCFFLYFSHFLFVCVSLFCYWQAPLMAALFSICYNLYRYYCYYYSAPIGFNRFLLLYIFATKFPFCFTISIFAEEKKKGLRCIPRVPKNRMFKLGLWNARSVNNKVAYISEMIISNSLDILILTETWLSSGKVHTLGLFHDLLPGYTISNQPRHSRGGGLAILSRSDLTSKINKGPSYKSFTKYLDITLTSGNMLLRVISIYRPPISAKNKLSFCQFLTEFSDFLERIYTSHNKIILAGDFNIKIDLISNSETDCFMDILGTFDLYQHIHTPTQYSGHILDLVITKRSNSDSIYSTDVFSDAPSDHSYIICNVDFPCLKAPQLCITKRNIRSIKIESFIESVKEVGFDSDTDTIDRLVEIYNSNLLSVLDTHAPLTCKNLTSRPKSQWYSDDLRN